MNNNNALGSRKDEYKYLIEIHGKGAETVIGSVPGDFASYWSDKTTTSLASFITTSEADRPVIEQVEPITGEWHDNDNLSHVNGPFIQQAGMKVYDVATDQIVYSVRNIADMETFQSVRKSAFSSRQKVKTLQRAIKVFHFEESWITYQLTTTGRIDISNITFTERWVDGMSYLEDVLYEGHILPWFNWETQHQNFGAQIVKRAA